MILLEAHPHDTDKATLCIHLAAHPVPDGVPLDDDAISTDVLIATSICFN